VGPRGLADAQRFAVSALRPRRETLSGMPVWQKVLAVVALVALNVALFVAPFDYARLGALAYAGAFLLTLVANAAVVVPLPYIPVVANIVREVELPVLAVLLAALGSALGESVAFAVGRAERDLFTGHRWSDRLRDFFSHEWRAGLFLFLFAVPLNPIFDVGGLGAGALGISFRTFFVAVLLGRVLRFALLAALAFGLVGAVAAR